MASSGRFFAILGLLLGAATAMPSPVLMKRLGGNVPLRILPLGDTLTYGGESGSNSYRSALRDLLTADGNPVDFVGSQTAGDMADNQVEAGPGLTVAELVEKADSAVPEYLPNLVLINAGAGDCAKGSSDVKDTMLELLRLTWKKSIVSSIVLSTVPPSGDADAEDCIEEVNVQYRALVTEQQAISKKVVLVDFAADSGLSADDVGTADGYEEMARLWFAGIKDAASRGWVEKPEGDFTAGPSGSGAESTATPTSKNKR